MGQKNNHLFLLCHPNHCGTLLLFNSHCTSKVKLSFLVHNQYFPTNQIRYFLECSVILVMISNSVLENLIEFASCKAVMNNKDTFGNCKQEAECDKCVGNCMEKMTFGSCYLLLDFEALCQHLT